jgi:hypothetical protein
MSNTIIEKKSKEINIFSITANSESVINTITALKNKKIQAFAFDSVDELKHSLLTLIPERAEVMIIPPLTLDTLNITQEILNSNRFDAVKNKLKTLDAETQRKMDSDTKYTLASVHVVTEKGEILIASTKGNQLSTNTYSFGKIILMVGTQKIVKNKEEGIKRIYEYILPHEDERGRDVSNIESKVEKILTLNSEPPNRITILFLKQNIGF